MDDIITVVPSNSHRDSGTVGIHRYLDNKSKHARRTGCNLTPDPASEFDIPPFLSPNINYC
jgi:hypothetical protein